MFPLSLYLFFCLPDLVAPSVVVEVFGGVKEVVVVERAGAGETMTLGITLAITYWSLYIHDALPFT